MSQVDPDHIKAALAGDQTCIRKLVDLMAPVVHARVVKALARRASARSGDMQADAADLAQEVFVALFTNDAKALRGWDPTRGLSFLNFVGLLTQCRVADMLRTRKWRPPSEELVSDASQIRDLSTEQPESVSASRQTMARLMESLEATQSPKALEMFQRLYVDAQSVEQVVAETGMSANTVHQWRSRLGKAARDALQTLQSDESANTHGHGDPHTAEPRRSARPFFGRRR